MENTKYVGSNERINISIMRTTPSVFDDVTVDLYFHITEIEKEKIEFVKAVCKMMINAIKKVSECEIEFHNLERCEEEKYARIQIDERLEIEDVNAILIKACELIEESDLDTNSTNPNNILICKYRNQIKAYANEIKKDIINKTDYKCEIKQLPWE